MFGSVRPIQKGSRVCVHEIRVKNVPVALPNRFEVADRMAYNPYALIAARVIRTIPMFKNVS